MRATPPAVRALAAGLALLASCRATPSAGTDGGPAAAPAVAAVAAARRPLAFDPAAPAVPPALVAACRGARVVGLGEFSHGTHDDAMFKSALALALIDAGQVDTLYIEANRTGGEQLDAFIHSGTGNARDAVRDASIFRVLKSEAFAYLVAGMKERAARGRALRIVGIDCQDTRVDAEFALARLAARDAALADRLRARLAPVLAPKGSTPDTPLRHPNMIKTLDTATLRASIDALQALRDALAGDPAAAAVAERAVQGCISFEHEVPDGDKSKIDVAYSSRRDRFMAENILADGATGAAFWGHNIHVMGGPTELMEGYASSGSVLRLALGRAYRIVVCDYISARVSAVVSTPERPEPDATDARAILTRDLLPDGLAAAVAGSPPVACWIDLSSIPASAAFDAWSSTPRNFDWPGFRAPQERNPEWLFPLQLGKLVDVVVVLDDVGPARWLER